MEKYIKFDCEECYFKIKTLLKNARKKGKCPNCKALCFIPDPEDEINILKDLEELEVSWDALGQGDGLQ